MKPVWAWPAVLAFAGLVALISLLAMPDGGFDWRNDIGPATRNLNAPWREGLPLPPWAAVYLAPLGALPDNVATAVLNGVGVLLLALVAVRFGGPPWAAVLALLTPAGYFLFENGQTDALILAGVLLPAGLAPVVLILKPQLAIGAIVAILGKAKGRRRETLAPLAAVGLVSLVVWWGWPAGVARFGPALLAGEWNASLWPYSAPIGLVCMWLAWRSGDVRWGLIASPLLAPYVNWQSYIGILLVVAAKWPRAFGVLLVLVYVAFGVMLLAR